MIFKTHGTRLVTPVGFVADFEGYIGQVAWGLVLVAQVAADRLSLGDFEHVAFPVVNTEIPVGHVRTNDLVLAGCAGCAVICGGRT